MSQEPVIDVRVEGRDTVSWAYIFRCYLLVFIMLLIPLLYSLGFNEKGSAAMNVGAVILGAIAVLARLLKSPLETVRRDMLSARPDLEDTLQWIAIAVLWLFSGVTIIYGIMVLPAGGSL